MAVYKREWKNKEGKTCFSWYFHKTIDGVRYRERIPTARTMAQAQEAERKRLAEIHVGTYGKPTGTMKIKEFIEKFYLPWSRANKRSWRNDESRVKPILAFFGKKMLCEVDAPLVLKYRDLRRASITKRGEKRSIASVNRELQLLSRVFSRAIAEKKWHRNPCWKIELEGEKLLLKGERKRKRWLRPKEREQLEQAITKYLESSDGRKNVHLGKIILLDLNTGLRRTELLKLRPVDCDFESELILVRETKTDEPREVPMNVTARAILEELVEQSRDKGYEYIFTNPRTGTRYKDVKKAYKELLKDAGIADLWFHDLRHSFATAAGNDPTVSLPALAATLGHKNVKTTMIYTHATDEGKRRVVEAAERFRQARSQGGHKEERRAG
jgi:integrase